MFKLLIKSKNFVDELLLIEINKYIQVDDIFNIKINKLDISLYEIEIMDEVIMFKIVSNLLYYSRLIENIYLKIFDFKNTVNFKIHDDVDLNLDFIKKKFRFEIYTEKEFGLDKKKYEILFENLILKNSNSLLSFDLNFPELSFNLFTKNSISYLALDLIGFKLSKRAYKTNFNMYSINSIIVNYCFYLMNLDKIESENTSYSIIDPIANTGDIIIESSLFNLRKPIHLKKSLDLVLSKLFDVNFKISELTLGIKNKNKNKYIAIVQNNKIFKELKENISYSSQKIKISQYDLDFLDIKFKKSELDYVITQFPGDLDINEFESMQKEFFYMTEFIFKKYIAIISKKQINELILKKYKLKILEKKQIENEGEKYYIYIINKIIKRIRKIK